MVEQYNTMVTTTNSDWVFQITLIKYQYIKVRDYIFFLLFKWCKMRENSQMKEN